MPGMNFGGGQGRGGFRATDPNDIFVSLQPIPESA